MTSWKMPARPIRTSRPKLDVDVATSRRLAKIPRADTGPERTLRAMLHARGLRYRLENRNLPGSPDMANRSRKWAAFVNGCFWHHHKACKRATIPKGNRQFWLTKFADNRKRDARAIRKLRAMGYSVLLVWQCEIESEPDRVFARLDKFTHQVLGNRAS